LAQALAALSEEAGKALDEVDLKTEKSSADFQRQPDNATKILKARNRAGEPGRGPPESGREPSQLGPLLPGAGDRAVTAGLVSVFWLWLRPPTIETLLNPKMVAEHLKPP
jgi:hypothetical protein